MTWIARLLLVFALLCGGCSAVTPAPLYRDFYQGQDNPHLRPNNPGTRYINEVVFQRIEWGPLNWLGEVIENVGEDLTKNITQPVDEFRTFKGHGYTITEDFSCNTDLTDVYFAIIIKF
jgi:hypothetical protein